MRIAIYPGSFDPVTNGHLDIVKRALRLFDRVIVAVAHNPTKHAFLTVPERVQLLKTCLRGVARVEVDSFSGLAADYAKTRKAAALIRGLRAVSDFEYEFQMALMNRHLDPSLETVFLMPDEKFTYLSSNQVREIVRLGGNVRRFIPPPVAVVLKRKFRDG